MLHGLRGLAFRDGGKKELVNPLCQLVNPRPVVLNQHEGIEAPEVVEGLCAQFFVYAQKRHIETKSLVRRIRVVSDVLVEKQADESESVVKHRLYCQRELIIEKMARRAGK